MKQIFFLLIICSIFSCQQNTNVPEAKQSFGATLAPPIPKIKAVGAGEYQTCYLTDDGNVWQTNWNNTTPVVAQVNISNVKYVEGGQYEDVLTDNNGSAWYLQSGTVKKIADSIDHAYGCFALVNGNLTTPSAIYIKRNGTLGVSGPWMGVNTFTHPDGKVFKKLALSSTNNIGNASIYALATDGSVWKYSYNNSTPTLAITGGIDITTCGYNAAIVKTDTDLIMLAGAFDCRVLGLPWGVTKQTSLKSLYAAAKWPLKEIAGNSNTLHIRDADDNMFAVGANPMGEIGNGKGIIWEGKNATNQWPWTNGDLLTPFTQIPGKWKNIQTSPVITFYKYAQDLQDNWYSWGRNKARSLGNGVTLSINEEAVWPNNGDVWTPKLVKPLEQKWTVYKYTAGSKLPATNLTLPVPPVVLPTYSQVYVDSLNAMIKVLTLDNQSQSGTITTLINENNVLEGKRSAGLKALQ